MTKIELKKCPKCRTLIAKTSQLCENCGLAYPFLPVLKAEPDKFIIGIMGAIIIGCIKLIGEITSILFLGLFVTFIIIWIPSIDFSSDEPEYYKSSRVEYTLEAEYLASEYKDNEVYANSRYENKIVIISGQVDRITNKIWGGGAYVVLDGNNEYDITCSFSKNNIQDVLYLSKGSRVAIKGKIIETIFGSILMTECKIIEN